MNYLRRGYLKIPPDDCLMFMHLFLRQNAARICGRFDIMRSIAQPPGTAVVSCVLVKLALLIQLVKFYMHRPSSCRFEHIFIARRSSQNTI